MKVVGSVEQKSAPVGWDCLQGVNTIAEASDHSMGYMAFCSLSGKPLAF